MNKTNPLPERDWPLSGKRHVARKFLGISWCLLCLGILQPGLVRAATGFQGTNSARITINDAVADNQGNVTFTAATPYPSTIAVSGLTGEVSHVSVTLRGLFHTSCGDISMLLVPPDRTNCVVLMSEAGGFELGNPPVGTVSVSQLTFDDAATTKLYTIGKWWAITNGAYQPTDAAASNYFLLPAPAGGYSTIYSNYNTRLSGLNGAAPNGTWSLFVQDESPADTGVITNGWSLTIATAFGISGTVASYGASNLVSGVNLTVSGGTNTTAFTDTNGGYHLLVNQGGTYSVTPSKTNDSPPNDGVTTFDILLIRQHILNSIPLNSAFKLLAADANGSGSVTTADILPIRQLVLGNTTNLPAGLWKFVPASYVFPDPKSPWGAPNSLSFTNVLGNIPNQDFVAIKVGDVNNSWSPQPVAHVLGSPVQFKLPNLSAQPADTINTALKVGGFQAVTSVQFTMQWDPLVLQFVGVSQFGLSSLAVDNFGTNHIADGQLTFSWDDPQLLGVTLADDSALFTASFRVVGGNGDSSSLAFVDLPTSREVTVNAQLGTFDGQNGAVTIGVTNAPPSPVLIGAFDASKTSFQLSVLTVSGATYVFEYTDTLPATGWTTLSSFLGDGSVKSASDQNLTNKQRFYRVRVQ
ncbi:MAG TPA: cohesin domain-containing protein [Candidatus Limnocylindrales bacterium]|nr:cohesin domain-containing protein [Candidatus Limnocylindrales bacterium]